MCARARLRFRSAARARARHHGDSVCRGRGGGEGGVLTWIFDGGDYQLKPVGVGAPAIGHVLERHEVGARKYRTHRLFGVPAREVRLVFVPIDVAMGWMVVVGWVRVGAR